MNLNPLFWVNELKEMGQGMKATGPITNPLWCLIPPSLGRFGTFLTVFHFSLIIFLGVRGQPANCANWQALRMPTILPKPDPLSSCAQPPCIMAINPILWSFYVSPLWFIICVTKSWWGDNVEQKLYRPWKFCLSVCLSLSPFLKIKRAFSLALLDRLGNDVGKLVYKWIYLPKQSVLGANALCGNPVHSHLSEFHKDLENNRNVIVEINFPQWEGWRNLNEIRERYATNDVFHRSSMTFIWLPERMLWMSVMVNAVPGPASDAHVSAFS